MLTNFAPLPEQRYAVIYADPPWDYKGQLQHAGAGSGDSGGAVRHFATVTTRDLIELPVAKIAEPDAVLFLWATSPHLDQAIELGKAWGFAWATVAFVWDKQRVNPGHYTLSQMRALPRLQARPHPAAARPTRHPPAGQRAARAALREARRCAHADRSDVSDTVEDRAIRTLRRSRLGHLG